MHIRLASLAALLCAAAQAAVPGSARAEAWVVVPVVVGSAEDAQLSASRAARPVADALASSRRVIAPSTARERFETRASSPPVAATHGDLDQLARDAQQALYHVAMGLYTSASADVERVMSRADRALESLNRETLAARQLLDSCLFIVRARLQARKPKAAREQAFECRRLVPDIEPEASMHPPDVIGELAAAEAALEMQKPGSLRVTSSPSGCPVFVQGRNLGQTPLELPRLTRGEYRVQVECVPGQYGRVHRVTLGPSRTVVHVDSHLDAAVQTGNGVSLRYATQQASERSAGAHAIEVGRAVGARQVALITPEPGEGERARITALEVEDGNLRAAVIVRVDATGEVVRLKDAIATLDAGNSLDFTAETPAPLAPPRRVAIAKLPEAPSGAELDAAAEARLDAERYVEGDDDASRRVAPPAVAWALGGAGAAALVASWGLYAHHLALDDDYRKVRDLQDGSEARRRLERIESFELAPPLAGVSGAALLTASLPLLLPASPRGEVPAWALILGAGGLLASGTGAFLLVRGGGCDDFDRFGRCDDLASATRLGALVLGTAVPLLAVPVVYWIRGLGPEGGEGVAVDASPEAFLLRWRGAL